MIKIFFLLTLTLFFSGCGVKSYERTQTKVIIIKSPKIKFADTGYVRNSDEKIELELFMAGKCIDKISVNHLICVSDGCMSKSSFNKDYLSAYYDDDVLQNILLGTPIYGGKNKVKTEDGFEQNINDEHVEISYKVIPHAVMFKDKKNNIIFNIKDTE
ncbi:MAG: hypothetical protein WC656_05225 [Sulfurimonas sp.]|jgi:hypothetical protein